MATGGPKAQLSVSKLLASNRRQLAVAREERTARDVTGDETTGRYFVKEVVAGLFLSFGDFSFKRQRHSNEE